MLSDRSLWQALGHLVGAADGWRVVLATPDGSTFALLAEVTLGRYDPEETGPHAWLDAAECDVPPNAVCLWPHAPGGGGG